LLYSPNLDNEVEDIWRLLDGLLGGWARGGWRCRVLDGLPGGCASWRTANTTLFPAKVGIFRCRPWLLPDEGVRLFVLILAHICYNLRI